MSRDTLGDGRTWSEFFTRFPIRRYPKQSDLENDDLIFKNFLEDFVPKEPILRKNKSKVIAVGSCFASNVIKYLNSNGFVGENVDFKLFFYSDEFFTTTALSEQFKWINSEIDVRYSEWYRGDTTKVDHKRISTSEPNKSTLIKQIKEADSIILTFGLTEVFIDSDGRSLWRTDKNLSQDFHLLSFLENINNIRDTYKAIRSLNKECAIIMSLSPVPLTGTFSEKPSVVANMLSKSTLRTAIGEFYNETSESDKNIYYWPSYEIIKEFFGKSAFESDGRHIKEEAIEKIMDQFVKYFYKKEEGQE
jgi:hypothetical protein